jgi:hypothetical protein
MDSKPWWASRTIIFNAIAIAVATAVANIEALRALLPPAAFQWFAFVLPIVNVALRTITTQPVTASSTTSTEEKSP